LNSHLSVLVVQGGKQPRELRERIEHRPPEDAGVDGVVEGPHLHHHVHEPAQAGGQRGDSTAQFAESATMIRSALRRSRKVSMKGRKVGDPASSSPSTKTVTPIPSAASSSPTSRSAVTCAMTPALSSAAPRP